MKIAKRHLTLVLISAALFAQAQLPCETVLLVNTNSQDSLKIAAHFAAMRKMPQQNVIYLGLDENQHQITQPAFSEAVWEPVQQALKTRGLTEHVLAWIYSAGFPYRIKTSQEKMSITGLTFTRNVVPEKKKVGSVSTALYFSPLFRGPGINPDIPAQGTGSLDRFKQGLGANMPIPAMMLGYTGPNGNTVDEVLTSLQNGLKGDHTRPQDGIHFVKTGDQHRSLPREWQFSPVQLELAQVAIEAATTTNFPVHAQKQWGLMTGQSHVVTEKMPSFVPGAVAEHMTSFAAKFDTTDQTKCTEWIRAGATATAGTVTEPYSIWWKFPHARFFTHYARGCTVLESFYQSLLNPIQTLCLGEPFCRPWRFGFGVGLIGFPHAPISEKTTVTARCQPSIAGRPMKYAFFIDGKLMQAESPSPSFRIDPESLSDGYHELCVVAKVDVAVNHGTQAIGGFMVNRKNRTPKITGLQELGNQQIGVPFETAPENPPARVRLYEGIRLLAEAAYSPDTLLRFHEKTVGEGPHTVQVAAVYADGAESRSAPVPFTISFAPQPAAE